MVITGFLAEGRTDLYDIDNILYKVKKKISQIAEKEYGKLLGEEVALLCDNISLNVLTRNDNNPIINVARANVDKRIRTAGATGSTSRYNMAIYVRVMYLDGNTYIEVNSPNTIFLKAFKIGELEEFSLSEDECKDERNKKTIVWQKLHGVYEKMQPLSLNLSAHPDFIKEKVVFPSIPERAETLARHSVMNRLLNQISGGEQIPPYLLMPYMDIALTQLTSDSGIIRKVKEKALHLGQILLKLEDNEELVFGTAQEGAENGNA